MTWVPKKFLPVRVSRDGKVEFDDFVDSGPSPGFHTREARLGAAGFRELTEFLLSEEVVGLEGKFPPASPTLDHAERLSVTVRLRGRVQKVSVVTFGFAARTLDKYPPGLLRLACRLHALRKGTSLPALGDPGGRCEYPRPA